MGKVHRADDRRQWTEDRNLVYLLFVIGYLIEWKFIDIGFWNSDFGFDDKRSFLLLSSVV